MSPEALTIIGTGIALAILNIASAKDDKPVSVRPFDAIIFSLGPLALRGCGEWSA